ncbi:endonuclease domain-containing protein [candidate division KSB1 bacterium]|nr:endonuclease domain-containing protein [candidate division KSB1 bacterium]
MTQHFNRITEKARRKQLRNNPTEAEQKLWQYLKEKQVSGVKFRRQYSVDAYILDFYSPSLKLAIEVDGPSHLTSRGIEHDENRTTHIEGFGIRILRFTNDDVYENIEGVIFRINEVVQEIGI